MKNLCIILFIHLFTYSCMNQDYFGYVYDADNESPLEKVEVYDSINNLKVFTNKEGYFLFKKKGNVVNELFFIKKGYSKRKIKTISIQNGEFMKEYFKGEKIYLFNEKSKFRDSINELNKVE